MRFFAQTREIFNGSQSTRQAKDHIDGHKAPQLQPGQCRTIDTKPQRLTNNDVGFSGFLAWKTAMKKIDNRQHRARDCDQDQDKESPARPDVWKRLP